jgi:serine/threonine protein kinase
LTKEFDFTQTTSNATSAESIIYTAPELVSSESGVRTPEADVYSYGVLLYVTLTKQAFFAKWCKSRYREF